MPHRENETRRRRRAIECCAESLVCCDDPKCALPADCCADADCCKPKAGGAIRSTKSFKSRPAARLPALNKRLVAACICLGVAACALCLPVVSAGGGHGGELRPGFLKCEIEESGEEHCETDYEALAEHCSELELDEYNLGLHVGAVFIQIGVSFIGCMIPIVAKKWTALKVSDFNFSLFKHFGAGIILATGWVGASTARLALLCIAYLLNPLATNPCNPLCPPSFIHMLPPAFSNLTNICLPDSWLEYPFAGLLAMLAVLFTQFVQTMAVSYLKDFETPKSEIAPSAVANKGINEMEKHADSTAASTTDGTLILDTRTPAEKDLETHAAHPGHGHDHGHSAQELMDVEHTHNLILAHRHRRQITVYILEMGIATHSFIIGLALGVSRGSEMTALMIALAFHQFFEGMALSATVLDAGFKTLCGYLLLRF